MCTLYERIQELCKKQGVSGSRMCIDLGLSKSTMSELKYGRTKGVSIPTAKKIANYFGITVDELYGIETDKEKAPTVSGERDVLDEVDIAFYNGYKDLNEDDKATIRDMVLLMRQRRANGNSNE